MRYFVRNWYLSHSIGSAYLVHVYEDITIINRTTYDLDRAGNLCNVRGQASMRPIKASTAITRWEI